MELTKILGLICLVKRASDVDDNFSAFGESRFMYMDQIPNEYKKMTATKKSFIGLKKFRNNQMHNIVLM